MDELNYLVIEEANKLTEDNWYNEILQVVEKVLKDHRMIPDEMILRWANRAGTRERETIVLYLPETTDAFSLFSGLTRKLPNEAHVILNYVVVPHYSLVDTYMERQSMQAIIDKAVIALYTDKTNREVREYEKSRDY